MGLTALVTGSSRLSILALIGLFVAGIAFLLPVRVHAPAAAAPKGTPGGP